MAGQNRLDVELAPMEHDASKLAPAFELALLKVPWGSEPEAGCRLVELSYQDIEAELPALGEPPRRIFSHDFRIDEHYGDWCWLAATPYVPADRGDVVAALQRLQQALAQRDTKAVLALIGMRRAELCAALRLDPDEIVLDEHDFFESYFQHEDWQLQPLAEDELLVLPEAGGRLVRVTRTGEVIALLGRGGLHPFAFEVTFSKIDGCWLAVR